MSISTEKLEKFVQQLQEAYSEESFLQEYVERSSFNPEQHTEREYVQIGKRSNLPKRFFFEDEAVVNQVLSNDFAKTIAQGEKRHILSTIEKQANSGHLSQVTVDDFEFDIIIEAYSEVYEPDYLFLPNNTEYRQTLFDWQKRGHIETGYRTVAIGQSEIEIKWIPSKLEISGGFLFNSDSIEVVQKQYKDADRPDEADFMPGTDWCSEEDFLMTYFGKKFNGDPDEFDFWLRTIISEPRLKRGGICHLKFDEEN
ncbi:hypothetical protein [Haloarcula sediminis]|uniref:hypothetical protein n=1 Tax=Haloarcula sediminis TaxID=3111777 RepID=UPI002D765C12|nr:hypothetical protein [Haloarcula sp. CK38]